MRETILDNRILNYDYIKGVAIISVVLLHLFSLYTVLPLNAVFHIGNAVPLFLITTILLRYKKLETNGMYGYWHSIKKDLLTVFIPFFFAQLLLVAIYHPEPIKFLLTFGMGMGAYYPFIHAQVIVLAPIAFKILNRNFVAGSLAILAFCIISEGLFSYLSIPQWTYRILFTRYCFLYVIGFLLLKSELLTKYKYFIAFLTILSSAFVYFHCYHGFIAFFYPGWIGSKFPRDFISLCWFIALFKLCNFTPHFIRSIVTYLGRKSYDIFIIQMMFFCWKMPVSNIAYVVIISFVMIFASAYIWGKIMDKLRKAILNKLT